MARRQRPRRRFAGKSRLAQIKVRLPEALRWSLESEASSRGHSMNTETTTLIAKALLSDLDDAIVGKMVDIFMRDRAEETMADEAREDEQIKEGLK
jgi:hypothetical protein